MTKQRLSEQSNSETGRRFTRTAYSVSGARFEVWADEEFGRVTIEVEGVPYILSIGHVEQLQAALAAAVGYLAAGCSS